MKLTDRVQILDQAGAVVADLPAHVGYSAELVKSATAGWQPQTELQVMIPPHHEVESRGARVAWRGKTYAFKGEIKIYRRNGRDHHFTIMLGD